MIKPDANTVYSQIRSVIDADQLQYASQAEISQLALYCARTNNIGLASILGAMIDDGAVNSAQQAWEDKCNALWADHQQNAAKTKIERRPMGLAADWC